MQNDWIATAFKSRKRKVGQKRRSAMDGLEDAVQKRGCADLQLDLSRADLKLRVAEFAMVNVISVIVCALLGRFILGSPVLALVFGVIGFFLPRLYVNLRKRRRLSQFNDQLETRLRSGARFVPALVSSVDGDRCSSRRPFHEFHRVVQEIGLGLHYEQALGNMSAACPATTWIW